MPITDSAKKAMRQTATNRARNLIRKDAYKQALKKFRKLIVGKNFDDAPEAFAIYEDKIYIASHKNFYQINDFKKKLVFQNTFWNNLYPNSLVIFDENNIFMGIRSGVVKLDVQTKKTKFFKFIK